MKFVYIAARLLLGLIFLVLGLNGFFHFIPGGPPPGPASDFYNAIVVESHYSILVFGVQVICGLLLLSNQYVALALVTLAAVLANILTFHITMWPASLPLPLFVTLLWFLVCWPIRSEFATLLARKPYAGLS
jgi:putative oxidoreductase